MKLAHSGACMDLCSLWKYTAHAWSSLIALGYFLTLCALMSSASAIIGIDYRDTVFCLAIVIFVVLVHGVHAGENYRPEDPPQCC